MADFTAGDGIASGGSGPATQHAEQNISAKTPFLSDLS